MKYETGMIRQALLLLARNDYAGFKHKMSQLRSDSEMPTKELERLIENSLEIANAIKTSRSEGHLVRVEMEGDAEPAIQAACLAGEWDSVRADSDTLEVWGFGEETPADTQDWRLHISEMRLTPDPAHDVIGNGTESHYDLARQLEMRGYDVDADADDNEHSYVRFEGVHVGDIHGDDVAKVTNT